MWYKKSIFLSIKQCFVHHIFTCVCALISSYIGAWRPFFGHTQGDPISHPNAYYSGNHFQHEDYWEPWIVVGCPSIQ